MTRAKRRCQFFHFLNQNYPRRFIAVSTSSNQHEFGSFVTQTGHFVGMSRGLLQSPKFWEAAPRPSKPAYPAKAVLSRALAEYLTEN